MPKGAILHYEPSTWTARNLLLVPHYAYSISVIQKRKPLGASARRAGWVGCNILLGNIPRAAKIAVVVEGAFLNPCSSRRSLHHGKALKFYDLGIRQ
ncbi:MAG: hypothetical protein HY735_04665 [Verrucomicrobia bacterium]|nr:hypothetical protein [Verrucomicrobiota bacterium]